MDKGAGKFEKSMGIKLITIALSERAMHDSQHTLMIRTWTNEMTAKIIEMTVWIKMLVN